MAIEHGAWIHWPCTFIEQNKFFLLACFVGYPNSSYWKHRSNGLRPCMNRGDGVWKPNFFGGDKWHTTLMLQKSWTQPPVWMYQKSCKIMGYQHTNLNCFFFRISEPSTSIYHKRDEMFETAKYGNLQYGIPNLNLVPGFSRFLSLGTWSTKVNWSRVFWIISPFQTFESCFFRF